MPEWTEITITSDYINHTCNNLTFNDIEKYSHKNCPSLENLKGKNFFLNSCSYGKILLLNIQDEKNNSYSLIFNFGMTGFFDFNYTEKIKNNKHTKIAFFTKEENYALAFNDVRNFGNWKLDENDLFPLEGGSRSFDPVRDFEKWKNQIENNIHRKTFNKPIYEMLLDQKWFNGVGNYLRSTILYYIDDNPFISAKDFIQRNPCFFNKVYEVLQNSYKLGGGQIADWKNPFQIEAKDFKNWVFYRKGMGIKTKGRTFWFNPKYKNQAPKKIDYYVK